MIGGGAKAKKDVNVVDGGRGEMSIAGEMCSSLEMKNLQIRLRAPYRLN
jgi:hypothetical protein